MPENLFQTHLESSHEAVYQGWMSGEVTDEENGGFIEAPRFDAQGALDGSVDGDKTTQHDVYSYSDTSTNLIGARYHLDKAYYCSELVLYSGLADNKDIYRVYASDTLETLYSDPNNLVTAEAVCDGSGTVIEINRKIQYVAIFYDNVATTDASEGERAGDGTARVFEFELWSGEEDSGEEFVSENLFETHLDTAATHGVNMFISNGAVEDSTRFSAEKIAQSVDGDLETQFDVYGATTWEQPRYVGALYVLDDVYYVDRMSLYAGIADIADDYRIYASDSMDDLYTNASLVTAEDVHCTGTLQEVSIGKNVQYVAIFHTTMNSDARIREFQLWSGEEDSGEEFESENLFRTHLDVSATHGVNMFISNGAVEDSTRFSAEKIAQSVDGDLETQFDVYGATTWEQPRYVGALYVLDDVYYADRMSLYAGIADIADDYRIYASDSLDDLYTNASLVTAEDVHCTGTLQEVSIGKHVQYVAIFHTTMNSDARIREFQLWSGEDPGEEPEEPTPVKVLTIGNSFSENASAYATAIASNQGYDLTFAYLKVSSCTLDLHWQYAQENSAVYKFELTDSTGRHTFNDEDSTGVNGATIEEALEYTDWDIIVFQEGSTSAADYANYSHLGDLIDYVQQYCPDAEIMLHEIWSWSSWAVDSFDRIESAYHRASEEHGGLTIIPTGRAFEFARTALGDRSLLNASDNQHANEYGKFVAGACYVATIFGCDINDNTLEVTDSSVTASVDMAVLRQAVMDAMAYVPGDSEMDDSLISGKNPEAFGVAYNNLFSPADGGSSKPVGALTDGLRDAVEFWGGQDTANTSFVFLYNLGANYDLTSAAIYAVTDAIDGEYSLHKGIETATIYASRNYLELFDEGNGVVVKDGYESADSPDQTSTFTAEAPASWQGARYVAFVITIEDSVYGACRLEEFQVDGTLSATQDGEEEIPDVPEIPDVDAGIIAGKEPSAYGVTYDNLFAPADGGCSSENGALALTDGSRSSVEFWGGRDVENTRFVFIYQLGANYDLTDAAIYATADAMDGEYNVHKGIKTATIYASRNYLELFDEGNGVVVKDGYENEGQADTASFFQAEAPASWQGARYVAFVITIDDSVYGACRLDKFQVNGTLSASQDTEEEIPEISDVDPGIIAGKEPSAYGVAFDNLFAPTAGGCSSEIGTLALTDGSRNPVEFWGGSDVENSRFVFIYQLGANYDLTDAAIYATADVMDEEFNVHKGIKTAAIYASRNYLELFDEGNGVVVKDGYENEGQADTLSLFRAEAPASWQGARYVAFVITIDDSVYGACRLDEFQVNGTLSAAQDAEEEIPEIAEVDPGIIAGMEPMASGVAYDDWYNPTGGEVNSVGEHGTLALTDGSRADIEFWGGQDVEGSRFVFIYNLGANYDLTDAAIYATADAIDGEYNVHKGIKTATIYASRYYAQLFDEGSGVVVKDGYENADQADSASRFQTAAPASWRNARYVAFVITIDDSVYGACRLQEFQVNGTRSAVQDAAEDIQTGPQRKPSIIEGIDAEYYGVATDDLADPIYAGASEAVSGLTDGQWNDMEFWGGADVENSRFVFIYNLYANYDLTGAAIDSVRDTIDEEFNVHKGIKSATIYASRTFETLFDEANGVVVKSGYEDSSRADWATNFEAQALDSWKMARYVAFVITIDDSRYGACRLQELQVYGTLSAEQDEEPEEVRLPQYLDLTGDYNVTLRLFQKNGADDLEALGARLVVTMTQEKAELDSIVQMLGGKFDPSRLYDVTLVDANGQEIPLDGRIVRLSLPAEDANYKWQIACVDDYGAEIVSNGVLNGAYTVETETLRAYAPVRDAAAAGSTTPSSSLPTVLWVVAIAVGVLAVGGIAFMTVAIIKRKKA